MVDQVELQPCLEAELCHWFFQKLNPEQRKGFLFAAGVTPRTCDLTLGMQHKAIERIAAALSAYNPNERLREALEDARQAIASLDTDALGMAQIGFGEPGVDVYPIRDELLAKIDAALSHKE